RSGASTGAYVERLAAFAPMSSSKQRSTPSYDFAASPRPRGLGFPDFTQLIAALQHKRFGLTEVGINLRTLDGVTRNAASHQIARVLLPFASARNDEIHAHHQCVFETGPSVQSAILTTMFIPFQNLQTFLQSNRRIHQR